MVGVGRSRPRSPGSGEAEFSLQGVGNVRPRDAGSGEAERGLSLPYWADGNLATVGGPGPLCFVVSMGLERSLIFLPNIYVKYGEYKSFR